MSARFVPAGRVVKPHGVRGELRVNAFVDAPWPEDVDVVELEHGNRGRVVLAVRALRVIHEGYLITLEGLDSREAAKAWKGATVSLPEHCLPATEDSYYLYELEGATAHIEGGAPLGVVERVVTYAGQDLAEVRTPAGALVLYPLNDTTLLRFDREAGVAVLLDIPGLVEAQTP